MFKTIVLALDGSDGSRKAIPVGDRTRPRRRRGDRDRSRGREKHRQGRGPLHFDEDEIKAAIHKQADELSAEGIDTRVRMGDIMLGGPAHVIQEIANSEGADVIVVGTRGHSPVAGLLLGSVTQRLLHIARRPVLAVPEG